MQLKALCSFSGPDGHYEKGVIFPASSDDRARWLIDFGYAAPVDSETLLTVEEKGDLIEKI